MNNVELILGPPGTGKTTSLIEVVELELRKGTPARRIGYVSFTKRAVEEAATRAVGKFNLKRATLPYFKTIHALAFMQLGLHVNQVLQRNHYQDLGRQIGVRISGVQRQDLTMCEMSIGDQIVFIESLARLKCLDLRTTWEEQVGDVTWLELNYVVEALHRYKQVNLLTDYADMLTRFNSEGVLPDLDVLIVDEAQDLCLLQWRILERFIAAGPRVVIAGDDDQAIFRWSGAAVDYFTTLARSTTQARVLGRSYRLPATIKRLSDDLIGRIKDRAVKSFEATEVPGTVERVRSLEDLNLSTGEWLILVRNNYLIKPVLDHLRYCGYLYSSVYGDVREQPGVKASLAWEKLRKGEKLSKSEVYYVNQFLGVRLPSNCDNISKTRGEKPWYEALDLMPLDEREYYRACRRRGESFIKPPRIQVNTIHGSKGSERENVVLSLDMSLRSYEGYVKNPDDEVRVYYVGVTRAKRNLYIIQPQTNNHFQL